MERPAHDHLDALNTVRGGMPRDELLCDLADLFKIFGEDRKSVV